MIKWKKLIDESVDEKAFKKLLKQNGITKLPSGTKFSDGKAKWNKEGGHAGEKTLSAMRAQLRNAGWQKKNGSSGASPDGSSTGMENEYVSPDGQIVASYCSYYGATVHDNFYSFTFKMVGGGVNESSRFGFNVGDMVELTKDKSNTFTGETVKAGTQGEVVAVDKPMPGVIKVKIEGGKVVSVPERQLKKAGEDEEPWKKLKAPEQPKRDIRPEKPEDYYMRPTTYGSPRFTGD